MGPGKRAHVGGGAPDPAPPCRSPGPKHFSLLYHNMLGSKKYIIVETTRTQNHVQNLLERVLFCL